MATFERILLARKHLIINDRYNVIRKIGGGSFGDIFLGINVNDGEVNNTCNLDFSYDIFLRTISCVKTAVYFGVFVLENGGLGVYLMIIAAVLEIISNFYTCCCIFLRHSMFYVFRTV